MSALPLPEHARATAWCRAVAPNVTPLSLMLLQSLGTASFTTTRCVECGKLKNSSAISSLFRTGDAHHTCLTRNVQLSMLRRWWAISGCHTRIVHFT